MDLLPKVRDAADALAEATRECAQEQSEKAVHHVRTRCRRMEAVVSAVLATPGRDKKKLVKAGESLLRRLKKLRRSAGAVRDLDIHLSLITNLPGSREGAGDHLTRALQKQRADAANRLQKELAAHAGAVRKRAKAFLLLCEKLPPAAHELNVIALTQARFLEAAASMPRLTAENLHDFRKRSKHARYIAELDERSHVSARWATKLNRIQDAIGTWHDWDVMAAEANQWLKHDGAGLKRSIRASRKQSFNTAMRVVQRTQKELLREAASE